MLAQRQPTATRERKETMNTPNLDFEALKDITRLAWLLNFEAIATVPNVKDALTPQ